MSESSSCATAPRRTAREWKRLVEEQRDGVEGLEEFCQRRSVAVRTFKWWRWAWATRGGQSSRRRRGSKSSLPRRTPTTSPEAQMPAFIEIARPVPASPSATPEPFRSSGVEVVVVDRCRERHVRVETQFDVATLQRVVAALEEA